MKNLILFALLVMPFGAIAQQMTLGPANQDDGFISGTVVPAGPSDYVVVGKVQSFSDHAFIGRYNDFGSVWAKAMVDTIGTFAGQTYTFDCAFNDAKVMSNGDIVAVGHYQNNTMDSETDALVARFDQNGNAVWIKTFGTVASEYFSGVDTDPAGNIYVTGTKTLGVVTREIYGKLDASGTPVWMKEALRSDAGNYAKKVCYFGDTLFVAGQTFLSGSEILGGMSNGVITVTRLSASTGNLINQHLIGTHSNEVLMDAAASNQGIFLLVASTMSVANPVLTSSRVIMRYGRPYWQSLTHAVELYDGFTSPGYDIGGRLAVYQNDIYVSGGAIDMGVQKSYVVKSVFGADIVPSWGKLITSGSLAQQAFGTATLARASDIVLTDVKENSPSRTLLNRLTAGGSTIHPCQQVQAFDPSFMTANFSTAGGVTTLASLSMDVTDKVIKPYAPSVVSCLSPLPVTLISFTGEKEGRTSLLRWQTASESGTSHFEIERQDEEGIWKVIGFIAATGTSQTVREYEMVDEFPHAGANYYRLRTVDDDGTWDYSETVVVVHEEHSELLVYPNPASVGQMITVAGSFTELVVHDQLGRQVPAEMLGNQLSIKSGPGVYLLTVVRASSPETVRIVTN